MTSMVTSMPEPKHPNKGEGGATQAMCPVFVMYASKLGIPKAIETFRAGGFREYQLLAFVEESYRQGVTNG